MSWTITIEIVDCATPATKLAGVEVLDGSTNTTSHTDANGRVSFSKDDSLSNFIIKTKLTGYLGKNFPLSKAEAGTTHHGCLDPVPTGVDPSDPNAPTGYGGDTGGGCFIVTATTGSPDSVEIIRLRRLRDRVANVSGLGRRLIQEIYREYALFSPSVATRLEEDELAKTAALWVVVKPLLAWYTLAGTLALGPGEAKLIEAAGRELSEACPQSMDADSILALFEGIREGKTLPPDSHPLLLEFGVRIREAAQLRFAGWAIFDPLVRTWQAAKRHGNVVDEVSQWLANAPLEKLAPPAADVLERELVALSGFLDFMPAARRQLGSRLAAAWPWARTALERTGFIAVNSLPDFNPRTPGRVPWDEFRR